MLKLSQLANEEVRRLLDGKNPLQSGAIAHLASSAGRSAESLVYLADIDDLRFGQTWLDDAHHFDAVDDGHVRWAATGALTSLDLCMAAAARLGGFAERPPHGEDSIRTFYSVRHDGTIHDKRSRVLPPWRGWLDSIVQDSRYDLLLRVRNTLVHADSFRIIHGTTGPLAGHGLRYGYNLGPLIGPVTPASHKSMMARDIIVLSRDISLDHVGAFVEVLRSIPV